MCFDLKTRRPKNRICSLHYLHALDGNAATESTAPIGALANGDPGTSVRTPLLETVNT